MKPAMIATLTALAFSLTFTTSGLAAQKTKLDAALKTDLPAVNKLLADRNQKPLEVRTEESR